MGGNNNNLSDLEGKRSIKLSSLLLKTASLLFAIILLSTIFDISYLGNLSLYNTIFPGRVRLPFGENPELSYNFTLNNLNAMFSSHVLNGTNKEENEFRIIIVGDSSSWGILLKPEETLSGLLNIDMPDCNGKDVQVYNLGYPTLSLTKDVMIMEYGMRYSPDLIIWQMTLESFPHDKQISTPLVKNNLNQFININKKYGLQSPVITPDRQTLFEKTILGKRREIADLIRLQSYGPMWAATGIDQIYPIDYQKAKIDLENSTDFHDLNEADNFIDALAFYSLENMLKIAGDVPIVFINEPILISNGANSNIRYNFYYPKWAYDSYRQLLRDYMEDNNYLYMDVWDLITMEDFTNSAIHLSPEGEKIFSDEVIKFLKRTICNN